MAVVDDSHGVFDASARVEQQGLGRLARLQLGDRLRGQGVEPREAVVAGEGDDGAVGEVDDRPALRERALLAERVSVVEGRGADGAGAG